MATNFQLQLRADLLRHEGKRNESYKDTEGVWTNGVGHTGADVYPNQVVSDYQVYKWLEEDTKKAEKDASSLFKNYDKLSPVRRGVLVNMAFNLGKTRLSKFKKMIAAVEAEDFDTAALEMMDSKWFSQVKTRAVELVSRMKTNTIKPSHQYKGQ